MQRCIDLARLGAGYVSPNPLVGAVLVYNEKIIGEGWHQQYGGAHAEVNAIAAVSDVELLKESTLYVNLEPCSHHGKTPPCADLIITSGIKQVVVGMQDPNPLVSGKGIQKLQDAGIKVTTGILEKECIDLNKRFITYITKQRPYVILKWAESSDGLLSPDSNAMSAEEFEEKRHLTGFLVQRMVHKWRSEEDAIMVGTNTVISDDPALNARAWKGRDPIRIAIDRTGRIPETAKIFNGMQRTFVFTENMDRNFPNTEWIKIDFNQSLPEQILAALYVKGIASLIIEGGAITLKPFIEGDFWDEVQRIISPKVLDHGVKAPVFMHALAESFQVDQCQVMIYRNDR